MAPHSSVHLKVNRARTLAMGLLSARLVSEYGDAFEEPLEHFEGDGA